MQGLVGLFPRWVVARSLGAGILYFLMQVGWLSWYAYGQCPEADDSNLQGCIWYVYKQVPSTLPLAAVFAVGVIFAAEMLERFADSFPPTDGSSKWRVRDWLWIILLASSTAGAVLGFTTFSDEIPLPFSLLFVVIIYCQVTQPWVDWVKRMVGAEQDNEEE